MITYTSKAIAAEVVPEADLIAENKEPALEIPLPVEVNKPLKAIKKEVPKALYQVVWKGRGRCCNALGDSFRDYPYNAEEVYSFEFIREGVEIINHILFNTRDGKAYLSIEEVIAGSCKKVYSDFVKYEEVPC